MAPTDKDRAQTGNTGKTGGTGGTGGTGDSSQFDSQSPRDIPSRDESSPEKDENVKGGYRRQMTT